MKEFNQEQVTKRFTQLPGAVQDLILSDALANTFLASMQTANLSPEKVTECNHQATLVLVGLSTTKEFKEYVMNELGLRAPVAQILFETVSAQVFIPVRDCLLKAFDQNKTAIADEKQPETSHSDPYREQTM
jgi:hypothetical protein